ncbi:ATP synthase subunit I [Thermoflavimicrobium daqui]|jgi:hypothetical protein|uniref:ATP synthase subunit I n=1 Tax=Thermoflavimicrobium daqui TaxID=2137476 RepID=A0A364K3A3_9BACL|nr:ATP synthase subunit I [Thermoflavimicrobium daqui]RAL23320.1 hypothetical protein DL897_11530 [Thermoflavimicrobium daqui]
MDLMQFMRRQLVILTAVFLSLLLISWFLTPYKTFIAGIALGILTAFYNVLHLARRLRLAGELAIQTDGKKMSGLGVINRFLMVTLGVIILYKFPEVFDYRGFALGLPICYFLPFFIALVYRKKFLSS